MAPSVAQIRMMGVTMSLTPMAIIPTEDGPRNFPTSRESKGLLKLGHRHPGGGRDEEASGEGESQRPDPGIAVDPDQCRGSAGACQTQHDRAKEAHPEGGGLGCLVYHCKSHEGGVDT